MKKNIISLACSAAAVLACVSSTQATPAIRWSFNGGSSWTTVQDGDALDTQGAGGEVSANINLGGGFTLTTTGTGVTKPLNGSSSNPEMTLNVGGGGTTAGGTLIVEFTETDFSPVPQGSYLSTLALTQLFATGTTLYTFIGSDTQFQGADFSGSTPTGTPLDKIGPLSSFALGSASATDPGQPSTYSITLAEVFTLPGSATAPGNVSISAGGNLINVPDGGNTLMLLGSALSVLGLGVFRKSQKAVKA